MDQYSNFLFYGSWKTLLDGFDKEQAKELLWQIVNYGVCGYIDTEDPIINAIIFGAIVPNIEASQKRYMNSVLNGSKGGRPKKEVNMYEVLEQLGKGISKKSIAKSLNISVDTLNRRLDEIREKDAKPQNLDIDTDTDIDNNTDIYSDIDTDSDNENDTENDTDNENDIDLNSTARDARLQQYVSFATNARNEPQKAYCLLKKYGYNEKTAKNIIIKTLVDDGFSEDDAYKFVEKNVIDLGF